VSVIVPEPAQQAVVMDAIYGPGGVKAGGFDLASHREALQDVARALADAGAEVVLLACTELSVVDTEQSRPWPIPAFDAADLVARRVVELAGGTLRRALVAEHTRDARFDATKIDKGRTSP
jgi:aspartate racemase